MVSYLRERFDARGIETLPSGAEFVNQVDEFSLGGPGAACHAPGPR